MKKLILLELAFLFLATTFSSNPPPPGWYQQTLPVNDYVNDIFFLDSLNGWVVTEGNNNDTGYILKTTDGGNNWIIQFRKTSNFTVVQFVDSQTGYVGGGSGTGTRYLFKSSDGGNNWVEILGTFAKGGIVKDLSFVNQDVGWYCDDDFFDGGVFKTINGGLKWMRLTDPGDFTKLFFLNGDTGWVSANGTQKRLYRTTNGGTNWELQFTSAFDIGAIFFLNGQKGWIKGGSDLSGNGVSLTTDGGFTWINGHGENGGFDIKFVTDSIGYAGGGSEPLRIIKSTNGGKNWGYQHARVTPDISVSTLRSDTLLAWAGNQILNHTSDGGGTIVDIRNTGTQYPNDFKLEQNFPNPFNPSTIINYKLRSPGLVNLRIFNIEGKEIKELVNQRQNAGDYNVRFDGTGISSGVYYYRIEITYEKTGKIYYETKKMILLQ
jgi:photosystem II stability/assembly factor-like uncharacterized protein